MSLYLFIADIFLLVLYAFSEPFNPIAMSLKFISSLNISTKYYPIYKKHCYCAVTNILKNLYENVRVSNKLGFIATLL